MADAKMVTKEQLKVLEEMKTKVDQHGDVVSAEDREFLANHIDSSRRACKLYLQLEEGINKKTKAAKTESKPADAESKVAELEAKQAEIESKMAEAEEKLTAMAKPKKKASSKKKKETVEQGTLLSEEPAKEEKTAAAVPEQVKEETAPGAKTWEPMDETVPAPEPVKEETAEPELDLDDLLG